MKRNEKDISTVKHTLSSLPFQLHTLLGPSHLDRYTPKNHDLKQTICRAVIINSLLSMGLDNEY